MSLVIVSQTMLWIAIGVLAFISAVLARQVGLLHQRIAPVGALALPQPLELGAPAPEMMLSDLEGRAVKIGGSGREKSQLLLFVSPDCKICEALLPAIRSAGTAERDWLEIVFASDGEPQKHSAFMREKGLGKYPYVLSERLGRVYGVSKLPYAVLIDEAGNLSVTGLVNTREHLESLFVAKEQGVPSIQQFLRERGKTAASGGG